MSYSSCSNSAIYHPPEYPEGAIGTVISGEINYTAYISGATEELLLAPILLPKGVWILSGSLKFDSVGATDMESCLATVYKNYGTLSQSLITQVGITATAPQDYLTLSGVIVSDGTAEVSGLMNATATANWNLVAGDCFFDLTRVA